MDHCDACGYTWNEAAGSESVAAAVSGFGASYEARLRGASNDPARRADLHRRPVTGGWSVIEYAAHVRDVFLAQRERLLLALVEDCPTFFPMYRDERVTLARYNDEDPDRLAGELIVAAGLAGRTFGAVTAGAWARRCVYNYPKPAQRTLAWLAQNTIHEGVHHLLDIDRLLADSGR